MILSSKNSVVTDGITSVKISSGSAGGEAPPWEDTLNMSRDTLKLLPDKMNFLFWNIVYSYPQSWAKYLEQNKEIQ